MLVKFTSPKTLKSWLKKYSVQKLKIEDGLDITQKFVNLCASLAHFRIRYWHEHIHCFAIILCSVDLGKNSVCAIFRALANVVIEASKSAPVMVEDVFDAIELIVNHISVKDVCAERTLLLDALLADAIYPLLIDRKNSSFGRIIRKYADEISQDNRDQFKRHIDGINDITQKVKKLYFFRSFYSKEFCTTFLGSILIIFQQSRVLICLQKISYRLMKNAGRNSSQLWKNRMRQGKHSQGCVLFLTG